MAKIDDLLDTNLRVRSKAGTLEILRAAHRAGNGLLYKGWKIEPSTVPDERSDTVCFDISAASLKEAGALRYRAGGKHGAFSFTKFDDPPDELGRELFLALLDDEETKIVQEHIGGFIPAGPKKVVGFEAFRNYLDVLKVEILTVDPDASCEVVIGEP